MPRGDLPLFYTFHFYLFGIFAMVSALLFVTRKSPVAAALWLVFMAALFGFLELTDTFGATYGPIAGTMGVLLWAFLTSVALFLGLAFAAQLEAVRAGSPDPREAERG